MIRTAIMRLIVVLSKGRRCARHLREAFARSPREALVRHPAKLLLVIPAKAGIQGFTDA
jgi:hypothetical protein